MTGPGTLVELNVHDSLGWIELDDGTRIRVGGTVLSAAFKGEVAIGTRVLVIESAPGFRGALKAMRIAPLEPIAVAARAVPERVAGRPWSEIVLHHPQWSDVATACLPYRAGDVPPLALPEHPLFAPWHHELCETAPIVVDLHVPAYRAPVPIDPRPGDSFAHGSTAFLDQVTWPACGSCAKPLEMCLQLAPAIVGGWLPTDRGLVALFCFHCGIRASSDPRVAHVALVRGEHRVACTDAPPSASSGWMEASQRVSAGAPRRLPPGSTWLRYRAAKVPGTASAALIAARVGGPFPAGYEDLDDERLDEELDDWRERNVPPGTWGGARLGGAPSWDQRDATPICGSHGEMLQLVEYNGGQFLDGALHIFTCRAPACGELAFVAEF